MSKILLEDIPSVIHQHMRCPLIEPSLYYVYLCIILRWWKNHLVRHWLHIMESALVNNCLETEKSRTSRSADNNWGWKSPIQLYINVMDYGSIHLVYLVNVWCSNLGSLKYVQYEYKVYSLFVLKKSKANYSINRLMLAEILL